MKNAALRVVSAALVIAVAWPAWAQAAGAAAAEALFDEAKTLLGAGKIPEACAKFEASHQIDPALGTKLYLADCYERSGRTASAWAMFREAASIAAVRLEQQRAEVARTRASALEAKLSKLAVKVTAAAAETVGLEVRIDGVLIPKPSWETPLPVDPGQRKLTASAPGHKPWTAAVEIPVGPAESSVEVPPLEPEPTREEAAARHSARGNVASSAESDALGAGETQRTVGLIAIGVGAAGLVVGGVLGLAAKNKNDDSKEFCPNTDSRCTQKGVDLREDAKDFARASNIAFGAGLALGITGTVLYLTAPTAPQPKARARFVVTPDVAPSGAGLSLEGSW